MSELSIRLSDLSKIKGIGPKTIERVREFVLAENGYISKYDSELHLEPNSLNPGDCFELMNGVPDNSIDMILADLPYGTTACEWDNIVSLEELWAHYTRIIKENGLVALFSAQPFTTELINSNPLWFAYDFVWIKNRGTDFFNSLRKPLNAHEVVCVFYKEKPVYNPQFRSGEPYSKKQGKNSNTQGARLNGITTVNNGFRYPLTWIEAPTITGGSIHPAQKPVELFEYLIRTYTREGDTVLDNTAGVYTTAIAAINTNRNYICIEKDPEYHKRGSRWVELVQSGMDYKEAMKVVKQEIAE